MKLNNVFKEITEEESVNYLTDENIIPVPDYPKTNRKILPNEIGFHTKLRMRLIVKSRLESVFDYKREGILNKSVAKLFGLNNKSSFYELRRKQ